jgi:hypothetical protein
MSIVFLVLSLGVAKLPESSTVEFSQTVSGMMLNSVETFRITQTGNSVRIAYDKRQSWWRGRGVNDSAHLSAPIPVDVYGDLWDSLTACRFFGLDSHYYLYSQEIATDMPYKDGYVRVEYPGKDRAVSSRKVAFSGTGLPPEPLRPAFDAVTRMTVWATASVEQARAGKIAFVAERWTPRMLRYIRESGYAPEMTRDIIALVDSTTTRNGPYHRVFAQGALLAFADTALSVLDSALSHPNPQVRLLALTIVTDTLGDRAVPLARKMLGDTFGEVRYKAAIFLAKRGSTDAMPVLYESLHDSAYTQSVSARVLLDLGTAEALDTMFAWAEHASYQEVSNLIYWSGIGELTDERVSPVMRRLFASGSVEPKFILRDVGKRPSDSIMFDTVAAFVHDHPGERTVSALLRLSKYRDALPAMRAAFKKWPGNADLMSGLGTLHDSAYFDTFVHYSKTGSAGQKNAAVGALAYFNSDLGRELKLRVLSSESASVYAVMAFITQPDPRAYNRLIALLQDEKTTPAMICWICEALGALGDRRAIPYVEKAYRESGEWGRTRYIGPALESLRRKAKK